MIKRMLEVGIHCNRVWLLIKHIFLCLPVNIGSALGKNFHYLFFSLGEPFPDAHVDLETMSELKFDANVTKQIHVLKQWVKGNIVSTTVFSFFINSLLLLAAGTKGKESKMGKRNVQAAENRNSTAPGQEWVGMPGLLSSVEYKRTFYFLKHSLLVS